jgi:YD repeat-containing protein
MTDGLGSVSYSYNQLSQLTSEARTFTGVGSFTLSYAYNLAGALTSLTDPFGAQVGYSYDAAGRTSAITGSGFAGVSNYLPNVQYRAWGALKAGSYGNSKSVAVTYDNALRPAIYEVPGIIKKSYQYYADGSSKFVQDQLTTNSKFDRSYTYDHAGRITTALSGAEARGGGPTDDRPYHETTTYDALGHISGRTIRHWDRYESSADSYVNNRRVGWSYDADGRLTSGSTGYYSYDAAGQVHSFGDWNPYKTDQQSDGGGRRAKTVLQSFDSETSQWTTEKITYYVTSTVLQGELISEVSGSGTKERTFVHAQGVLAVQSVQGSNQYVEWRHFDASEASYRATAVDGSSTEAAEMDPQGANAGLIKPLTWPPPSSSGKLVPYGGIPDLLSLSGGCVLDDVPVPCDMPSANGSAQCENNQCHRYNPNLNDGRGGVEDFHSTADGYNGYMPGNAYYLGGGQWIAPGGYENESDGWDKAKDSLPQNTFDYCFKSSGLATASFKNPKTGKWMQNASDFHEGAADVLKEINTHEGVPLELMAVTWMNESSFKLGPLPHLNPGNSYDWDYGPFRLNPRWIDKDIIKGNIKNSGHFSLYL